MKSYTFTISGDPIPLQRMRMHIRGIWDAQKQQKLLITLTLKQQLEDKEPLEGPLELDIAIHMRIPQGCSKKRFANLVGKSHYYKPDFSNILKFYEDCAQYAGIFKNDCQISRVIGHKVYEINPKVILTFKEIKDV